jgi:2-haloacid dehalogenase
VLKSALTTTAVTAYADFSKITHAALKVMEARYAHELAKTQRSEILPSLRKLPLFPDVLPSLEALRGRGFRLIALTNSTRMQ